MESTDYQFSRHLMERIEQRGINLEWVVETIADPQQVEHVADDEAHFFKTIEAFSNRCLKVVVNPTSKTIVTAHFDRRKNI